MAVQRGILGTARLVAKHTVPFPPSQLMRNSLLRFMLTMLIWSVCLSIVVRPEPQEGGKAIDFSSSTRVFYMSATMAVQSILAILLARTPASAPRLDRRLAWTVGMISWTFMFGYFPFAVTLMGPRPPGNLERAAAGVAIVGNLAFAVLILQLLWIWLTDVVSSVCACRRRKKGHR